MEWHLTNIPKIMFGFWGTEYMPYIRWLTLKTFRVYHPDWEMILYKKPILDNLTEDQKNGLVKNLGKNDYSELTNYMNRLKELNIKVIDLDVEQEMGQKFFLPYITCFADVMRYIIYTKFHGGHYVDLDNLYFRSMESMPFNNPKNAGYGTIILPPPYHHWLLSQFNAPWPNKVLNAQLGSLPQSSDRFLDTTAITTKLSRQTVDNVLVIPLSTTEENFGPNGPKDGNGVCLNWHGSGVYGKYNMVTEENYKTSDHPLAACVRYCLGEEIGNSNGIGSFQWIARGE